MKKLLKIVLIIFALGLIGGIIAFVAVGNTANADEYKIGSDTIKSIKAIVEKRQVVSVSTKTGNGVTTKTIEYKSNTVQEDLLKYTNYLRYEAGFGVIKEMDLKVIPSTFALAQSSNDAGKVVVMTIDYNSFGYTITIQKGEGTLNRY